MSTATDRFALLGQHHDRLQRAQDEMGRQGIDLLVVGPSSDLRYLIGYDAHTSERMNLLLLPREGDPAYLVPTLEASLLADRRELVDVHAWEETQFPRSSLPVSRARSMARLSPSPINSGASSSSASRSGCPAPAGSRAAPSSVPAGWSRTATRSS